MKTVTTITLFILTGIVTAIFFGFDISEMVRSYEYDDEQEGIKDEIVIKFSHVVAENTPKGMAAHRFARMVEERTDGKVKVEIHSNGVLYNDNDEWEAINKGNVQMIAPATSKLSAYYPKWQVLDLPFAFPSYQAVQDAYEGPIGHSLLKELKGSNVTGLAFWYNGYKQITNNAHPIKYPSDFSRLHFRIMPSPVIDAQFEAFEASTSTLPFNKTYKNLEVNFINGQENTLSNIYTKKFYQKQKYLTMSNHGYLGYVVLINTEFWEGLQPEIQEVIKKSLQETTEWVSRHSIEMNDQHSRNLKQLKSIEIHTLNQEQKRLWREAIKPVYEDAAPVVGYELMKELYKIQLKYGEPIMKGLSEKSS
ncbi:C4-dicarboxylate-binding protein DctP [Salirhabdus euzebyi]|uniref:C4-dicarboxylate-binding protein DctP n=1 Tax=Salirhabdus euzebyi TaxID=394506 RepID=A0A841Q540_9BACI|nr:DctP family TRAP transporter solute-binding subunit [Salirhabdus euzebyi]MBB6453526.1 C4-dicarboxylate-binding protein DctP [Salirhabdus euzebyi]